MFWFKKKKEPIDLDRIPRFVSEFYKIPYEDVMKMRAGDILTMAEKAEYDCNRVLGRVGLSLTGFAKKDG